MAEGQGGTCWSGSPQPSTSQLKRKGKRQYSVKKKPAPYREEGVHKYFYYINENVSSYWKDLAFHLDFRRSDIDNIDGRSRDDKSRCMDLLEEWLKCNGERATIEVLMEALIKANLQSVVDGLWKEFPEVPVDLTDNYDLGNAGMEVLQVGLSRIPNLAVLCIGGIQFKVYMTAMGMSFLAPYLRHLVRLRELYIRLCKIGDIGLESLTTVLSTLTAMQNLHLVSIGMSPRGMRTLVPALCKLTGAGLGRVVRLISALPALTRLNISSHKDTPAHLSDTAAMDLAEALPRLPALEELDLWNIYMEPTGFQAVVQAAKEHPTPMALLYFEHQIPGESDITSSSSSPSSSSSSS